MACIEFGNPYVSGITPHLQHFSCVFSRFPVAEKICTQIRSLFAMCRIMRLLFAEELQGRAARAVDERSEETCL